MLLGSVALFFGSFTGCANRAYNDLYIENMAAEIRDLEDQLYEYDHQYRILEQELNALRADNGRLQNQAPSSNYYSPAKPDRTPPLEFYSRGAEPVVPQPAISPEEVPSQPQSILENGNSAPAQAPTSNSPSNSPSSRPVLPQSPFPSNAAPAEEMPPPSNPAGEFDLDMLAPPTIEPGEPMPPPLPAVTDATDDSTQPNLDLELNLSRVEIPAQLASRRREVSNSDEPNLATIQPAVEKVTDTRVVELGFHPSLSRAANFDDESDDDGLYLVLQPLNAQGQMVDVAADLSIVVLDPSRDGDLARIGRWDYSAQDVKAKMQPIGSNQGVHLTLPWNGPDPGADRVVVFVRYTFPNGRQVIGEKTFFVSGEAGFRTVWVPRGNSHSNTPVAQASNQTGSAFDSAVRPASGTTVAGPAPAPQFR